MDLLCHLPTISSRMNEWGFFNFLFYTPLLPDLMRFLKMSWIVSSTMVKSKAGLTLALTDFFWIWIIWCLFSQLLKLLSHLIFKSLVRNFVVFADVRSYNPCEDLILLWPAVVLFLSDDPSRFFFSRENVTPPAILP